jgi:adenylate kinase family enzyme
MGKKNYLIEGVSGAGKTAVATELQSRGYHVVHGDRELVYRGDPETGEPVISDTDTPSAEWVSEHQLWDLEKVRSHIVNKDEEITFFCGGSRNSSKFVDLIDGVFILDVDRETMMKRIDERVAVDPTDFGATQEELDLILRLHETKKDIPGIGNVIDATQPLGKVVDEILGIIRTI